MRFASKPNKQGLSASSRGRNSSLREEQSLDQRSSVSFPFVREVRRSNSHACPEGAPFAGQLHVQSQTDWHTLLLLMRSRSGSIFLRSASLSLHFRTLATAELRPGVVRVRALAGRNLRYADDLLQMNQPKLGNFTATAAEGKETLFLVSQVRLTRKDESIAA